MAEMDKPTVCKGEEVLSMLLESNAQYARGETTITGVAPIDRERLSTGQSPCAAIITCADSRVSPEIMFRQGLGQLFVIRSAGNLAQGPQVLGSLQYAVEHLNVPLVIILGHSKCGAVGAAVQDVQLSGMLSMLIKDIANAIQDAGGLTKDVGEAVKRNVKGGVSGLRNDETSVFAKAEAQGNTLIRGAVYDIDTGLVSLVEV